MFGQLVTFVYRIWTVDYLCVPCLLQLSGACLPGCLFVSHACMQIAATHELILHESKGQLFLQ